MCVSVGEGCGVGCEEVMAVAPLVVMMVAREGEGWSVRVRRSVRRVLPLESGEQRKYVADDSEILVGAEEGDAWNYMNGLEMQTPYVRTEPKIGRNDPCPCGSGKKYKKCCGR